MGLIPENLFESELFGYRKGAFTGADRHKAGYFEHANRGTMFIDEIENIPIHIQGKLLSVIDERRIYPLGSTTPVDIDVRILAATNRDIRQCVAAKMFREDLFFRLGEFIITMPPLRERVDDIPFLAQKFILESSAELEKQIREITDDAVGLLMRHAWPGNVRELKNVVRKAVLTAGSGIIDSAVVEPLLSDNPVREGFGALSLRRSMRELERTKIREALAATGGNKKRAAEMLEMSYKNIHDKIKLYGLG
jgi:transcriptional regulator with PAS, ATPase and Fis domain